ncbi:MAG: hypothetical protein FGM33_06760 [Candidatus Kapabacteria bacterium]|nr:hypothetical protein [Candidatus Kapabacteria bacterium]
MDSEQNNPLRVFVDGLSAKEREAFEREEPLITTIYFTIPRIVRFVSLGITLCIWIYLRVSPENATAERLLSVMIAAQLVEPVISESFSKWRAITVMVIAFVIVQLVTLL